MPVAVLLDGSQASTGSGWLSKRSARLLSCKAHHLQSHEECKVTVHGQPIICDSWPQPVMQVSPWGQQPEDLPTPREHTEQGEVL